MVLWRRPEKRHACADVARRGPHVGQVWRRPEERHDWKYDALPGGVIPLGGYEMRAAAARALAPYLFARTGQKTNPWRRRLFLSSSPSNP